MEERADLASANRQREAAQVLSRAARLGRRHRLDLSIGVGYTGLDGGTGARQFVSPVVTNVNGLNASASLRYDLPVGNRRERGAHAQAEATVTAALLGERDLMRQIALDVDLAYQELTAYREALSLVEQAVAYHRQALASERARFEQGFSTLFNVLLFQDRLTLAEANRIAAHLRVAQSLAQLRFETGLLPASPDQAGHLSPAALPHSSPTR